MERLNAVTMIVSSSEHLARPEDRVHGGFNDWAVARRGLYSRSPKLARVIDVAARPAVTRSLHLARIAAGGLLLAPTGRRTRTLADAVVLSSTLLLHPRAHYGTDGTDQVGAIVSASSTLARGLHRQPKLVDAVLWGVALQATVSYAASGWVKVTSRTWRSGEALPGVTRTMTYGDARLWRLLVRYPRVTRMLCRSVLAMECGFPTVYALGGRLAPAYLHGTAFFHLVNARVMGLGRFVWAFGSMHPAVLYTSDHRHRGVRADTAPRVTGALGAAVLAAGAAIQARRHRRVLAAGPQDERLTTKLGNELVYRRFGPDGDGPVVILEHGLLSSPLLWQWTANALSERHTVVTYARAGYGASTHRAATPYQLDQAVDDLVDLAFHVSGGRRPVVLAGHSLGGWLAIRAARRAPALIRGVALVDSCHPGELLRSSRQAKGQESITRSLRFVAPSLAMGLGLLVAAPGYTLPADVQARFLDEYRDSRLWSAGMREWRSTQAEFMAFDGELPRLDCPVVSMTAEYTAKLDPIQLDLHRELADISAAGTHVEIPGVDHEDILVNPTGAAIVAERLAGIADAAAGVAEEEPEYAYR